MSDIELPVLRRHAIDGSKRLRRVVPLMAAAALSASLIAGAAGPASAAVRQPARTAPISLAASDNALPAVSLTTAARYVHVGDGRFTLPATARNTTITVLPGITLTINSTGIRLSLTKEAVTEVENVLGFGQSVASLVGAILSAIPAVPSGGAIPSIVASSLSLANGLLKLCAATDGSAAFTIRWFGLPSCSGFHSARSGDLRPWHGVSKPA